MRYILLIALMLDACMCAAEYGYAGYYSVSGVASVDAVGKNILHHVAHVSLFQPCLLRALLVGAYGDTMNTLVRDNHHDYTIHETKHIDFLLACYAAHLIVPSGINPSITDHERHTPEDYARKYISKFPLRFEVIAKATYHYELNARFSWGAPAYTQKIKDYENILHHYASHYAAMTYKH